MLDLEAYFDPAGPGVAVGIALDGRPVDIGCVGLADVESRTEITPQTLFDLASASKTFTAAAVLLLAAEGRLELRCPVRQCLEGWEDAPRARPVEVRDLLWHTSGLRDYLEQGMFTPPGEMSPEYVLTQLPDWSRKATPGIVHAYSNTNYFCLARIVESVTGERFAAFLASRLFTPFGLRVTRVAGDGASRTARGYRPTASGLPRFVRCETLEPGTDGDGGVVSTLDDLVRWHTLFWDGEIVGPDTVRRMCEPGTLDSGARFEYGFGLQVESHDGRLWCGHNGSWVESTVVIGRYVAERATVIVLSNEFMAPVERLAQRAFAAAISGAPGAHGRRP